MAKPVVLVCPEIRMELRSGQSDEQYVVFALDDKVQVTLCLNAGLNLFDMLGDCLHEAGALEEDGDNSQLRMH